jgi:hypothetical protein
MAEHESLRFQHFALKVKQHLRVHLLEDVVGLVKVSAPRISWAAGVEAGDVAKAKRGGWNS